MFSNIFFLILLLLMTAVAPENVFFSWFSNEKTAFAWSLAIYAGMLILLYRQNLWLKQQLKLGREKRLFLVNLELILFFLCFYFILGAQRFLLSLKPFGQTALTIFSILLYFTALLIFHINEEKTTRQHNVVTKKAVSSLRFLIPFVLPFIFFVILSDVILALPLQSIKSLFGIGPIAPYTPWLLFGVSIMLIITTMIFLPPLMVLAWGCPPLKPSPLTTRLDALCQKARFKHRGFRIWTVMADSLTAAIIGIIGYFRYILFTQKLLDQLTPEMIEAILAHEIGHSYRKHLWIYPLILFGMLVTASLASGLFYEGFLWLITSLDIAPETLKTYEPLFVFIVFAIAMAIYFRFVFGYFSRLFERQADLHVFQLKIPPEHLIDALNAVAISLGYIHFQPSWHHFSIQERIDFLKNAQQNPQLISKHHRKTYISLLAYLAALAILTTLLVF